MHTEEELFEELKKIIVSKLKIDDATKVTREARFREDLNADSLDTYDLVYSIEEQMEITIPPEKATDFEKVGDALDFIVSQKK
ncbi:acyl carrier protein [Entomospira nematocerorum]|uniref:Acyl carrier protein n=2 Tax=Entomospira TaxID=2834378 RepID=A0A968GC46_9SPIO|nr:MULTISPECIES: acyl carrier protein [Entomospira]NIZ40427.1 acyl carrier protein [Entomospira entomophilus]NIZ47069.1 acyl carrier protein [Entomospira nematocera]WDI34386.1 acyl carrier protein [Entomospira nematocera]WDI35985.1 acyl carrier protein [Entomospira entomophilus]